MSAAAVRCVFSAANRRLCLLSCAERREQQRLLVWEGAVQQQATQLHRHWRAVKAEAAAVAADAAAQVMQMEQIKQSLREKAQKERSAGD